MNRIASTLIILINRHQQILLFLRDNKDSIRFPNTWDMLGGFVEGNESPEACIRREIMEEIEIELGEIHFFKKYEWEEGDEYVFWKPLDLDLAQTKLNEGQRLAYFSQAEIDKTKLAFHSNEIVNDFFNSQIKDASLPLPQSPTFPLPNPKER